MHTTPINELLRIARIYSDAASDWMMNLSDDYRGATYCDLTEDEKELLSRNDPSLLGIDFEVVEGYLRTRIWSEADPITVEDFLVEVREAATIYEVSAAGYWQDTFSREPVSTEQMLAEIGKLEGWTIEEEVFVQPEMDTGHGILPSSSHPYYAVTDPCGDYGLVTEGSCRFTYFL